jgi:hypothetical protein
MLILGFILGSLFTFLFMFIPAVLSINERDDYRTQKAKGTQNHEVWEKEEEK